MSAEVADVLRDALALIEDERDWWSPQNAAMTKDPKARPQCASNAISAISRKPESLDVWRAAHNSLARTMGLRGDLPLNGIFAFNDTHTHAEVVAAFKDAIVAEEWSE